MIQIRREGRRGGEEGRGGGEGRRGAEGGVVYLQISMTEPQLGKLLDCLSNGDNNMIFANNQRIIRTTRHNEDTCSSQKPEFLVCMAARSPALR